MKKTLLYFFSASLGLLALSNNSFGQTAASATWALSTDKAVVIDGTITSSDQGLGEMSDRTYSAAIGFFGDGWQRLTSTTAYTATSTATPPVTSPSIPFITGGLPDYTHFAEYSVTSNTGVFTKINKFKISTLGGGTGNCRLVVLYSLDNFATAGLPMAVAGSYNDDATIVATEAKPVTLLNTSVAGNTTTPTAASKTIDQATLIFDKINLILAPTKTFTVRIYPFLSSASTTSPRYFASQNASISTTTASSAALLPLDFLSFTAKADAFGKTVSLNWSTANEKNTKNFEIQKRTDAGNFATIGYLNSKNTAGIHNYSFTDNSASAGNSYYRIVQFDNDGASKSSEVVAVSATGNNSLSVYPNPVDQALNINHALSNSGSSFKILSANGATVLSSAATANSTTTSINVSDLTSGAYVLVFDNKTDSKAIKFVKK